MASGPTDFATAADDLIGARWVHMGLQAPAGWFYCTETLGGETLPTNCPAEAWGDLPTCWRVWPTIEARDACPHLSMGEAMELDRQAYLGPVQTRREDDFRAAVAPLLAAVPKLAPAAAKEDTPAPPTTPTPKKLLVANTHVADCWRCGEAVAAGRGRTIEVNDGKDTKVVHVTKAHCQAARNLR